jgi:peptidoglycan/LPS O-acetylase OafA/YrhL
VFHYGKNIYPFNHEAIEYLFNQAYFGVSYFFILSGFVMIVAYGNSDKIEFGDYIKRRFARIYPVYGLAIIILLTYFIILHRPINFIGLVLNIALVQSWIPGEALSFNSPGWSLSVEMFFYFSFPFLFNLFYKKYNLDKLILIVSTFFIFSQIVLHTLLYSTFYKGFPSKSHDLIFYFPLMHFSEFLIGNIAGMLFLKGPSSRNFDFPIIGLIVLMVILLRFQIGVNYHNGMLAFIFIPLITLLSSNSGVLTRIFSMKVPVFLGEISYGIYILQKPTFDWINLIMRFLNINNSILIFYSGLGALIITSAISFKYIEAPLRRIISKKALTPLYK